jgi:uncharacterized membrane protein YedE/YeeE
MEALPSLPPLLWLAFALGGLFGAIAQRTHFCTLGAVSDVVNMGDWNRMGMWLLAMGVAIFGTAGLQLGGLIDTANAIYTAPRLLWGSHLVGSLLFGIGMVLASGCGAKTLVRLGGGNLKSLVVFLVMGLTALATLKGLPALWRANGLDRLAVELPGAGQDLPRLLAGMIDQPPAILLALAAGTVAGPLLAAPLLRADFRTRDNFLGGIGIGLTVVLGWWLSGYLAFVPEHPDTLQPAFLGTNSGRMESLTFVAPPAYALELFTTWSDASRRLTLGIATALGVVVGAAVVALASRSFRWEGFRDVEDTASHLIGAALMGFGGVCAVGCTIGQGLSGLSTLALGSAITTLAIIAGAWLALKVQYWRLMRA